MVYIWVRTAANWDDECAFLAVVDPAFRPKIEVWNAVFEMPFHRFRSEVRRIAERNLSHVAGTAVARFEEIPDGALVLPADDDDWFSPDVASVLEACRVAGVAGFYWTSTFLEVPIDLGHRLARLRRAIFPSTPPRWLCSTNNYAVVKRADTKPLLEKHTVASEWFGGAGREDVRRIEGRLSVMNRTLGSRTSLGFGKTSISRAALLRKYRRYRRLYRAPPASAPEWSRPYVAMMADLMDAVHVRPSMGR